MSTRTKFIKNTGWLIAGRTIQAVLSFIMSILMARYLMPTNYGLLNYSASIIALFSSLSALGFTDILTMFLVDDKEHEGVILGTATVLRFLATIVVGIAVYCILGGLNGENAVLCKIAILQVVGVLFQSVGIFSNWFQANLQSYVTTYVSLIVYIIISVYKLFLLMNGMNLYWFAGASIIEYMMSAVLILFAYYKHHGQKLGFAWEYGKRMLHKSYHFIISGFMLIAYNQMDRVMLGSLLGETFTGIYTVALNLCNSWTFILGAVIASAAPIFYEINSNKNEEFLTRRFKQLNFSIIIISAAVALLISLLCKPIILIIYGEAYSGAIIPLMILSWYSVFQYLGHVRVIWEMCKNCQKYEKYFSICGLILNFFLNYLLIPTYGVIGAALATLLTQVFVNFVVPWFVPDLKPYMKLTVASLRPKDFLDKKEIGKLITSIKSSMKARLLHNK